MKLLIVSAFCLFLAPMSGAQAPHTQPARTEKQTTQVKPKDVLPRATLDFKPVGDGLPVSAKDAFLSYPFCNADGTFYFNALIPPNSDRQIIAVSSKGRVNNYSLTSVPGLAHVAPHAMDAEGSNIYVLVDAANRDDLLDHDIKPGTAEVLKYSKPFILHFHDQISAPEEIPLDLPFWPVRFAAMSEGKFVVLGAEQTNQTPVLAVVDGSGQLEHYVDAYQNFGTGESITANAPQWMKNDTAKMQDRGALQLALSAAQFVHYRGSLLLLLPGSKAKVFTIRSGGEIKSTVLHLPAGFEAESIIPSDSYWFIRATDGSASGRLVLLMVDPATGKALRVLHSPQMDARTISCAHDGDFYGIHWAGKKESAKIFLMKAAR